MSNPPLQPINLDNRQNIAAQSNNIHNNIPPPPPFQGFLVFLQQQQLQQQNDRGRMGRSRVSGSWSSLSSRWWFWWSWWCPGRKIRHVYGHKRSNTDRFRAVSPRKRPYTAKSRLKIRLSVTINPDGRVGSGEAGGVSQINNINVRHASC